MIGTLRQIVAWRGLPVLLNASWIAALAAVAAPTPLDAPDVIVFAVLPVWLLAMCALGCAALVGERDLRPFVRFGTVLCGAVGLVLAATTIYFEFFFSWPSVD